MDPELVEEVELLVDEGLAGGDEEGQWEVERLKMIPDESEEREW